MKQRFFIFLLQILVFLFLNSISTVALSQKDSLVFIDEFTLPLNSPWGLSYHNGSLWISDSDNGKIIQIDTLGNVIDSVLLGDIKIKGLDFVNDTLWVVNTNVVGDTMINSFEYPFYCIYKLDYSNNKIIDSVVLVGAGNSQNDYLWGLTYYDLKLLVSFNGGWGSCLFQVDPELKSFETLCCSHPLGMTVIKDTLWSVRHQMTDPLYGESIFPNRFYYYVFEEQNDSVLGISEIHEREINFDYQTTDLAFDGRNLWIVDIESKSLKKNYLFNRNNNDTVNLINDIELLNYTVYPNPIINHELNIIAEKIFSGKITIEIVDIAGNLIFHNAISSFKSYKINTSKFPKGLLILKTTYDQNTSIHKIINH